MNQFKSAIITISTAISFALGTKLKDNSSLALSCNGLSDALVLLTDCYTKVGKYVKLLN